MLNKNLRAKLAKHTINDLVPLKLKWNPRARDAVNKSELIHYSPDKYKQSVSVVNDAKHEVTKPSKSGAAGGSSSPVATSSGQIDADGHPDESQVTGQAEKLPSASHPKIKVIQSDTFDAARTLLTANTSRVGVLNMVR
jgi:hypothetical protein